MPSGQGLLGRPRKIPCCFRCVVVATDALFVAVTFCFLRSWRSHSIMRRNRPGHDVFAVASRSQCSISAHRKCGVAHKAITIPHLRSPPLPPRNFFCLCFVRRTLCGGRTAPATGTITIQMSGGALGALTQTSNKSERRRCP